MWIDNEVYSEFEIMAKEQGWDDIVEFINHVLVLGLKLK
jgi:hypothetical protein